MRAKALPTHGRWRWADWIIIFDAFFFWYSIKLCSTERPACSQHLIQGFTNHSFKVTFLPVLHTEIMLRITITGHCSLKKEKVASGLISLIFCLIILYLLFPTTSFFKFKFTGSICLIMFVRSSPDWCLAKGWWWAHLSDWRLWKDF